MNIRGKLILAFSVMVGLSIAIGAVGIFSLKNQANDFAGLQRIEVLAGDLKWSSAEVSEFTASRDKTIVDRIRNDLLGVEALANRLASEQSDASLSQQLESASQNVREFIELFDDFVATSSANVERGEQMRDSAYAIAQTAAVVREKAQNTAEDATLRSNQASEVVIKAMEISDSASELERTSLEAETAIAEYAIKKTDAGAQKIEGITKEMFLTALSLKKLSDDPNDQAIAKKIASAAGNFRKAFKDSVRLQPWDPEYENAQNALEKEATKVKAFSKALVSRYRAWVDRALESAGEATGDRNQADRVARILTEIQIRVDVLNILSQDLIAGTQGSESEVAEALAGLENYVGTSGEGLPEDALDTLQSVKSQLSAYRELVEAVKASNATLRIANEKLELKRDETLGVFSEIEEQLKSVLLDLEQLAELGIFIAVGVAILIGGGVAVFFGYHIGSPLSIMSVVMDRLRKEDVEVEIPSIGRRDEVGQMASALEAFKTQTREVIEQRNKQAQMEREVAEKRKKEFEDLAHRFETAVGAAVDAVKDSGLSIDGSASQMATLAEDTHSRSSDAARATGRANEAVQAVAAASEELSASIDDVTSLVQQASQISASALDEATQAQTTVADLSKSSARIGDILTVISDIAEQTNLLALNATIEAARAGESGKGFAVVANEVKALAKQTADATDQISQQIQDMQRVSDITADAIKSIADTVQKSTELANGVADAVEQQQSATREIATSVQTAAQNTDGVTADVEMVMSTANDASSAAEKIKQAISGLNTQSQDLQQEINEFVTSVRTA